MRRDEVNPGRSRFGHSIIYNRCFRDRDEKFQTGLSCALCFRPTHARQIAVTEKQQRQAGQ